MTLDRLQSVAPLIDPGPALTTSIALTMTSTLLSRPLDVIDTLGQQLNNVSVSLGQVATALRMQLRAGTRRET